MQGAEINPHLYTLSSPVEARLVTYTRMNPVEVRLVCTRGQVGRTSTGMVWNITSRVGPLILLWATYPG